MNCRIARKQLVDLLDVASDAPREADLMAHLETCPECAEEFAAMKRAMETLRLKHTTKASPALKENVMSGIRQLYAKKGVPVRVDRGARLWKPAAAALMAVALLLVASFGYWLVQTGGAKPVTAFTVLGQAAHAMQGLRSVHISAQMRTVPHDNFQLILLDHELVPIDLWKRFTDSPYWRVETSGRVAVSNGEASLLWIKSIDVASEGPASDAFIGWLGPLMDVEHILDSESRLAQEEGSVVTVDEGPGPDGAPEVRVYVEASAQGDYTNDWLLNKSIRDSDNLRVYRLDAETMWLKGLQVYVHADEGDVLVFETTNIEYNIPMDDALFALDLPEDVSWYTPPDLATVPATAMTPDQAARAFLEACGSKDWATVQTFYPITPIPEKFKTILGGIEVLSIGTPFQSGRYPGWFVPYEIRLPNGEVKKHNLSVRNDNPSGRYFVDGGI